MTDAALHRFTTLSFDCYGTLIDWETGIWSAMQPLVGGSGLGRDAVLAEFALIESEMQSAAPAMRYDHLLCEVHDRLAAKLGLRAGAGMSERFGASVGDWPAFGDSHDSLVRLAKRYRLVVLSNVHRAGFAASRIRLGVEFAAVHCAEDIGSYKPDPANFAFMLDSLASGFGVEPADVLHVAQSLFHDHVPARAAGLSTAWIDRQGLAEGGSWGATRPVPDRRPFDFTFPSLAAFADEAVGLSSPG